MDASLELRLKLSAFIGDAYPCSRPAQLVGSLGELPLALERVAVAAQIRKRAWFAWTDEGHMRFVAGEIVPLAAADGSDTHGLRAFFHDDDGRLLASATWVCDGTGRWHLWDR